MEYVNFWMGHKTNYKAPHIPASDEHYFSREDVEFHRQLYKEKAMPHLRLETPTPSETDKIISMQQMEIGRLSQELKDLKTKFESKPQTFLERLGGMLSEDQKFEEYVKAYFEEKRKKT